MIEVTLLQITSFFLIAKQNALGIFGRAVWLKVNEKITSLMTLL